MAWQNQIPVIGGFFDNPEQEALTKRFNDMAGAYGNYRDLHADSRYQGLGAQLSMFGPVQEYLSLMMPGISAFDRRGAMNALGQTVAGIHGNQHPSGVTGGQGPAAMAGARSATASPPAVQSAPGQINIAGDSEWDPQRGQWVPRRNI